MSKRKASRRTQHEDALREDVAGQQVAQAAEQAAFQREDAGAKVAYILSRLVVEFNEGLSTWRPGIPACPHCKGTNVRLRERVWRYYDLETRESDGQLFALADWPPDIDDGSDDPVQLVCSDCYKSFPTPEGFDFEWGDSSDLED